MIPHARAAATALALTSAFYGTLAVAEASSAQASTSCHIMASAANIRSQPTTSSPAVGVAYKGWTCTYLDQASFPPGSHYWVKIKVTKTLVVGWIRDDLVYISSGGTCLPEYC